jgi:hypothetical protein
MITAQIQQWGAATAAFKLINEILQPALEHGSAVGLASSAADRCPWGIPCARVRS